MNDDIETKVLNKFEIIQKLGKGAYGIVWKALDRKQKQVVAIKKVHDTFTKKQDAFRIYKEVMILQELNAHKNIIKLINIIKADNSKDLYLIFEYIDTDLSSVIRAGILEDNHKRYIVYQILKALKYIHSGEIIHKDLKTSNILLNSDCHVKVADFGQAISLLYNDLEGLENPLDDSSSQKWYKSPENLLGSQTQTKAIDIWSVGCICGELILGKPIFPGSSTLNQLERILELTGKPKSEDVESIDSPVAWNILSSINISKRRSFQQFFQGASEEALDFFKKTLIFNPSHRLTVEQALKHKFLKDFSEYDTEIALENPINILPAGLQQQQQQKLSARQYKDALYDDIANRKKILKMKYLQKNKEKENSQELKEENSQLEKQNSNEQTQQTGTQQVQSKSQKDLKKEITNQQENIDLKVNQQLPQSQQQEEFKQQTLSKQNTKVFHSKMNIGNTQNNSAVYNQNNNEDLKQKEEINNQQYTTIAFESQSKAYNFNVYSQNIKKKTKQQIQDE